MSLKDQDKERSKLDGVPILQKPELAASVTSAFMQALMIGGVVPKSISARLGTHVEGRKIDDHGFAYMECHGGAKIMLTSSQVMQGHSNDHNIEVCGTTGSLVWNQENPDYLILKRNGQAVAVYQRNACKMTPIAGSLCRVPGGHPEAYLEGFGNVYKQVAAEIEALENGTALTENPLARAPGIIVGMMGNVFIERCQTSSAQGGAILTFDHPLFN